MEDQQNTHVENSDISDKRKLNDLLDRLMVGANRERIVTEICRLINDSYWLGIKTMQDEPMADVHPKWREVLAAATQAAAERARVEERAAANKRFEASLPKVVAQFEGNFNLTVFNSQARKRWAELTGPGEGSHGKGL